MDAGSRRTKSIRLRFPSNKKRELLFKTNEEALRVKGVRFVTSSITSIKDSRLLGTTDGSMIQQTLHSSSARTSTSPPSSDDNSDFETRSAALSPTGQRLGIHHQPAAAGERSALGRRSRHETLGAAGASRASGISCCIRRICGSPFMSPSGIRPNWIARMNYEANYAGTTFLAPPEKVLRKFQTRIRA